jgi:hypothetical protein
LSAGGVTLAGSYTASGTTTTWVPLIDASGSAIALINAASPNSPPPTTYTYDPSGMPTLSGQSNNYPFLYQGMEHEFTEPNQFYYGGDGQFYSAQIQRGFSIAGAQSTSGPGGAGPHRAHHGHHHGGSAGRGAAVNGHTDVAATADDVGEGGGDYSSDNGGGTPSSLPALLEDLYNFFSQFFGGGQSLPPNYFVYKARVERARRHPQYPKIDGVAIDIVLNQSPAAPEFCADPHPCNTPPLQRQEIGRRPSPEYRKPPSPPTITFRGCLEIAAIPLAPAAILCGIGAVNCGSTLFGNPEGPAGCVQGAAPCSITAAVVTGCYAATRSYGVPNPPQDLQQ